MTHSARMRRCCSYTTIETDNAMRFLNYQRQYKDPCFMIWFHTVPRASTTIHIFPQTSGLYLQGTRDNHEPGTKTRRSKGDGIGDNGHFMRRCGDIAECSCYTSTHACCEYGIRYHPYAYPRAMIPILNAVSSPSLARIPTTPCLGTFLFFLWC